MKEIWQGINKIFNLNNNAGSNVHQLHYDGNLINTNKVMANAFNDFFTKIGPEPYKEIPKTKSNKDNIFQFT